MGAEEGKFSQSVAEILKVLDLAHSGQGGQDTAVSGTYHSSIYSHLIYSASNTVTYITVVSKNNIYNRVVNHTVIYNAVANNIGIYITVVI